MREDDIRKVLADVCRELDWRAAALRCATPAVLGAALLSACGGATDTPVYSAPNDELGGGGAVNVAGGHGDYGGSIAIYSAPVTGEGGLGVAGAHDGTGGLRQVGGSHTGGVSHHAGGSLAAKGGHQDAGKGGAQQDASLAEDSGRGGQHEVDSGAVAVYAVPDPRIDSGATTKYMGPQRDSGS